MSRAVLDTSAVLAVLFAEAGADAVVAYGPGCVLSAVSYSETRAKASDRGTPPADAAHALASLWYRVVPFDGGVAEVAAASHRPTRHLDCSLADRACLATAAVHRLPAMAADGNWAKADLGVEVILFRGSRR